MCGYSRNTTQTCTKKRKKIKENATWAQSVQMTNDILPKLINNNGGQEEMVVFVCVCVCGSASEEKIATTTQVTSNKSLQITNKSS